MDQGQLMALTATWANLLPEGTLVGVQERLKKLPEDKLSMLTTIQIKKSDYRANTRSHKCR